MGDPLQKIFLGRRKKKGQGYWIKRSVPLLFIVSTWLGLLLDFPVTRPILWFLFSAATAVIYSILHFAGKRREFSIEFLFSFALIYAGAAHALEFSWLKLAFFPFIISMTAFYRLATIIPLSLLIPFLELKTFISRENLLEEIAFSAVLIVTAIISSLIFNNLRKEKEKAVSSFNTIRDSAREITLETGMESLGSEEVMSHYFASMLKTDEEIKDLLLTVKQAVIADSVNIFMPQNGEFNLRCSSEEKRDIIIAGNGLITLCIKDKKTFLLGELNEKATRVGYIKNVKITSLIVIPLMDRSMLTGVLTVDSSRYQAFSESDKNTVQMFANHLVKILQRERVYLMIKRDIFGLRILKEESANLVSSLDIDVIAKKLCKAAEKIAASQAFIFILAGGEFELKYHTGKFSENRKQFDLNGTIVNFAVVNKQRHYVSDTTEYPIRIMPFETENVRSVLAIPMLYENDLIGLFVMLSERKDFFDTFQTGLLEVICNLASTSVTNAKLHAEIEKLATTDSLTGLYNYRLFQEKLSEELKRLNRFSAPTSLILIDIDYFKKVNDTYGHPVGDSVLRDVAKITRETIRDIDIPARYGGEEFATILPGTDSEGARKIAERLRSLIMDTSFSANGMSFKITISVGIATSPLDARSKEELIWRADRALYYAKHNGRNQTILWSSMK